MFQIIVVECRRAHIEMITYSKHGASYEAYVKIFKCANQYRSLPEHLPIV